MRIGKSMCEKMTGCAAHIIRCKLRNAYKILVGKPKRKRKM
jgi:hypothetical protein